MSNLKWIKFYTSDWRSDIQLNLLTNTEKHIWIETLFLMAELEERGFLALNGESISVEKHAQLVRYRSKTVAHARQKWIKIGVCSVDSRGIIYSRRMVEETKKMLLDAINGKKGGNPNLMGLTPPLTHPLTDPLKQDTRYQILDTRKEKKKEKKKGVSTPFVPPFFPEVLEYAFVQGYQNQSEAVAKKFYEYFEAGRWIDSKGNPVKNWKQKFLTWKNSGNFVNVQENKPSEEKALSLQDKMFY